MLWLFLPFVVVLSGVVAYAADTIARRAGRKHIRLFGLRPKTTALLVAVLSGMAISAASLAAFLLLNRNAVATIAEADQLRPRIESLRQEVGAVQGELKSAQAERDQAQQEADNSAKLQAQAEEKLAAIRTQLAAASAAEKTLRAETRDLQKQVDKQTATLNTLEARAAENRKKLQKSEADLKASQNRAETLNVQVVELNTRVALAEQEAQSAQERAKGAQASAQIQQEKAVTAQAVAKAEQGRALAAQAAARQQVQAAQATAQKQVGAAQASVQQARQSAAAQIKAAGKQVTDLKTQVGTLEASRQRAADALALAVAAAQSAKQQQQAAQQARDQLTAQRNQLTAQRDKLVADGVRLAEERDQAAKERTQATADRNRVRKDLATLQQQQRQLQASNDELKNSNDELKNSNDSLARALADARASLGKLQDENLSSRTELSVSRNTDLAYPKNELVYAAVVPGVRNLDGFLKDAAGAAQARGAKATASAPSARLGGNARTALETKLRGLNVSTFVQCRAAQNAAVGFPVDLSCDARPNTVLYRGGEVIRRGSITLSSDPRAMQDQINDLVRDAVTDITTRGVPSEFILNKGLAVSELVTLLDRLGKRTGSTAVVGLAARDDVRPSMRVDLYPVLP
ncbi:DUF3084 domain-containing protein [Deinococcus frigens]|uniref:DUF3084 domain-containing protein n=1 Tax=Deinococcus frigens TaxID=249403 RepID=UPI0004973BA5|nr:DUF3084 domain-containing protein [Deinococcus frigens]